jgi:diacylglycerol kinase family enzyme
VRYHIILNEEAGKAGHTPPGGSPDELRAAFAAAGIDVEIATPPTHGLEQAVRAAVAWRPDAVVIGGGDGTVRTAAAILAGTGVPLGVLPLGTFNHFAKDLKLPTDVKEAVAILATRAARDVDVGEVNGRVFINNCSLGAYAEAVRRRDALRARRGIGKWWAMCRASFEEFRRLRRLRLRIAVGRVVPNPPLADEIPSESRRVGTTRPTLEPSRPIRTPVVVVGNNRYSGHLFSQSLRPCLDEGRLWLYTVQARRHLGVLRMMFSSLFGQLDETDALAAEPATEILIESDCGPVSIAADGEVLKLSPPFRFRIRPGALRVIAPAGASEGQSGKREAAASPVGSARGGGGGAPPAGAGPPPPPDPTVQWPELSGFFRFQLSGLRFPRRPEAPR